MQGERDRIRRHSIKVVLRVSSAMVFVCVLGLACQQREVDRLYEEAMGDDLQVAVRATEELGSLPGTATALLRLADRPGGERYDPVRIAAINALARAQDRDHSATLADKLRPETPIGIRIAIARALAPTRCNGGCVIHTYAHVRDLWVSERAAEVGAIEVTTPEEANGQKALRDALLDILRQQDDKTVAFARQAYKIDEGKLDPFVIWLAAQLNTAKMCPILAEFAKASADNTEREQARHVMADIGCRRKPEPR